MTIIESLYDYFKACPLLEDGRKLNISFLPADKREYAISVIPTAKVVKTFIDGSSIRQYLFTFGTSEFFDADTQQNISNCGFFENLSAWLETQSHDKNFPTLGDGQTPLKIEAQTTGYLHNAFNGNNARYQIQCNLVYKQRRI